MLSAVVWGRFLQTRGVDLAASSVSRLTGGEKNDVWRVESPHGVWVLRHYRTTSDSAEIDCELAALSLLADAGFPTPAPVAAIGDGGSSQALWEVIDGRPATLLPYVPGSAPPEIAGGYGSSDLALDSGAARLAARMHTLLENRVLPGRRSGSRDPATKIREFLASRLADHPAFVDLLDPLRAVNDRLVPIYRDPVGVRRGLVHNDITARNLVLGDNGEIVSLIDFDDAAQIFLPYELASITSHFGMDTNRRVDIDRVVTLVAAYDNERRLTQRERETLTDFLVAAAGAMAVGVLRQWLDNGRTEVKASDSNSAVLLLDLSNCRAELRSRIVSL